ncbi:hypothetical protein [Algoriphagus sp.]|uniref:hypothetical protein n=1 Tax=Algoriphagus sp. TaxID=1872435 RepID=UPI00391BED3A
MTLKELSKLATHSPESILKLEGRNFEPLVKEVLDDKAKGTPFEDSIELIGGQKFPDIVAKKFYGIEVKTTKQNHWRTTGNSVFEGTRVEGVERIFMLFAKLFNPIELKCRPYEEVLSEVVVTHSPRYLIDMNLNSGHTVFDKIQVPYDTLRKMDNPIRPIVDYYRTQLSPGEDLWWMEQSADATASNLIIRIWSNLSRLEREDLRDKAMAYFPVQLSNQPTKYSRMAIWLVTREGIVCPNIRDMFSAGGQGTIRIGGAEIMQVPRIIIHLLDRLPAIREQIQQMPSEQLSEFWEISTSEATKWQDWMKLAGTYFQGDLGGVSLREILMEIE